MTFSKNTKVFVSILLSLMISYLPHVAAAEVAGEMISTSEFVDELTREQSQNKIRALASQEQVQKELKRMGITTVELNERMAKLSNAELNDLAKQMEQAQYAGGVIGILLIVVLVLLIIYLAKRI